jgi:segregation and condensation protein A
MSSSLYRVELDIFQGPIDLLLYLVERQELDVFDFPIAKITGQFIEFLEVLELIDLDLVGDFVVMASALVEIKSRQMLPQATEEEQTVEIAGDPRGELIQQLLQYKKYKDASKLLEEQAALWQERFPRLSDDRPRQGKDPSADFIKDVELWDLVSALSRILRTNTPEPHANIRYDDTPISVYVERIGTQVRQEKRVAFSSLFEGENERSRIVGVFLAILELLRHHGFRAEQPREYHEIWVLPPLENPPAAAPEIAPDPADAAGQPD